MQDNVLTHLRNDKRLNLFFLTYFNTIRGFLFKDFNGDTIKRKKVLHIRSRESLKGHWSM